MKKKENGGAVQLPLQFADTTQPRTIFRPPIEPYVEGECHCECAGCEGKSGPYRHCYEEIRGCCLPKPF